MNKTQLKKSRDALQKAVDICGSQKALADRVGTTQATISRCLDEEEDFTLNPKLVIPIEQTVNSQVTRHQLRPDIYPLNS